MMELRLKEMYPDTLLPDITFQIPDLNDVNFDSADKTKYINDVLNARLWVDRISRMCCYVSNGMPYANFKYWLDEFMEICNGIVRHNIRVQIENRFSEVPCNYYVSVDGITSVGLIMYALCAVSTFADTEQKAYILQYMKDHNMIGSEEEMEL